MYLRITSIALSALIFTGCASVKMESTEADAKAKQFTQPTAGNAGVYVYRDSWAGKALKKDIWIDGKCLGETAPDVYFHTEVEGNKAHEISTESEFSPNALSVMMEAGKNYFIRQYMKIGVFVGGAGLEQINEDKGKAAVSKLNLATSGTCSQ